MRTRTFRGAVLASLALALAFVLPAQTPAPFPGQNPALPLIHTDNGLNSASAQSQHYVVLVSLDGFRWDYAKRDNAKNLLALGKKRRLGL
jgi:alkaline phosphatase D